MRPLALCGAMLCCGVTFAATFGAHQSGATWDLALDGRPALTYHAPPDGPKPFIDPLLTPAGHSVTTNRSGQPHHHGLWFTWGGLRLSETGETVDFWNDAQGTIVPIDGPRATVSPDGVRLLSENEWRRRSDGLVLLREKREIILHDPRTPRAFLITLTTEQTAVRPLVISHESNERVTYYGLAFQAPTDMHNGLVTNRRKGRGRSGVEGIGAAWCAYATDVVPARGIALFDHPSNPRHPNAWFTLDSGFLSTSLVAHEDYFLRAGGTLRLRYGILVFDGDFDRSFVSRMYERWLSATG
ncbi:MAG: hypothetical protein FJX75_17990 [Armatimonadetes bacterium]|nr:hypothetical protein [Armatimonadota bacterium]